MSPRGPRVYSTRAIILGQREFVEAAKVITILTPDVGKQDSVAKGVLKPKSRLAGHLEPGTYCDLELAVGKNLDIIREAQTISRFRASQHNLMRLTTLIYILELVDKYTVDGTGNDLFQPLLVTLERLDKGINLSAVVHGFELTVLEITGFRPSLDQCINCLGIVDSVQANWSQDGGGIVCVHCVSLVSDTSLIEPRVLKVLRAYQSWPYEESARITIDTNLERQLSRVMHGLMKAFAERDIKSADLLEEVSWRSELPDGQGGN
jgi:DNA repair protein RecO (recombination protein O)